MAKKTQSQIIVTKDETSLPPGDVIHGVSRLTEHDIYLFMEGSHFRLYDKLGAHMMEADGIPGTHFAVMAPCAKSVSVKGGFNDWNKDAHPLAARWDESGIWEGFIPHVGKGELYKFYIESNHDGYCVDKRDPFANYCEVPPQTSSIIWDLDYKWNDAGWMKKRRAKNALDAPLAVYEMHFGSWRRNVEEKNRSLTYREMVDYLVGYLREMGFTHVEFLPLMAFPFEGSWGYQSVGYFAPTSRYGTPQDFMFLIDQLHQ
ncbi:MAG: 1,4-alpha-glucan branching enzyme, partial [Candidatus Omnitrophica bacterium]|nr:1,4-alpha-glucan branching enzyme [Candidatus Omnitrophota bacterium]